MRDNSSNLDALRAAAVVSVMIDHLMPTLVRHGVAVPPEALRFFEHIGHAGVLAFFVHTSLVLMYSLDRLAAVCCERSLTVRFYLRRLFRIYPLAIACVLGVMLLGLPESTWKDAVPRTPQEYAANLLLIQNLWTGQSVLVPLWSLPYEVEMYVVLPLLYLVARRPTSVRWLIAILVAAYVGAYAFRKLENGHMNMAWYMPCFLAGVLCYALRGRIRERLPGAAWAPFVVGLIALYCYVHMMASPNIYWLDWAYCLVLAAAIAAFRDSDNRVLGVIGNRVATYSYGLYLLHVPALYVVYDLWAPGSLGLGLIGYVVLAAAGAVAAYHWLEAPMVALGRRLSEPRQPLSVVRLRHETQRELAGAAAVGGAGPAFARPVTSG